jgi:hypothetical protein
VGARRLSQVGTWIRRTGRITEASDVQTILAISAIASVAAIVAVASTTLVAQTTHDPSAEVPVKLRSAASTPKAPLPSSASAKTYVPPKMPWGDPDLSGNYTNKYEQGTPFERPQEFEGKRIEDVQGKDLVDAIQRRQDRAIERARSSRADPTSTIAGPMEFATSTKSAKRRSRGSSASNRRQKIRR